MMKKQSFTAKTQQGITFQVHAENTSDGVQSSLPVQRRPVNGHMTFCAILDRAAAQDILGITLPQEFEECGVSLVDQDGWKAFQQECICEQIDQENARLESMFPGLAAIQTARVAQDRYDELFQQAMENENTVVFPVAPDVNLSELYERFPLATAYLKAKSFARSSNVGKYSVGTDALKRLENGEDIDAVIEHMEAAWATYCQDHMWD